MTQRNEHGISMVENAAWRGIDPDLSISALKGADAGYLMTRFKIAYLDIVGCREIERKLHDLAIAQRGDMIAQSRRDLREYLFGNEELFHRRSLYRVANRHVRDPYCKGVRPHAAHRRGDERFRPPSSSRCRLSDRGKKITLIDACFHEHVFVVADTSERSAIEIAPERSKRRADRGQSHKHYSHNWKSMRARREPTRPQPNTMMLLMACWLLSCTIYSVSESYNIRQL